MTNVITSGNKIANMTGGVFLTVPLARTVQGSLKLTTSPASVIAEYIITTLTTMTKPTLNNDWPLYISLMPDGDEVETNLGAVYDTVGVNDPRQMNGLVPEHPGIQIMIRSQNHEAGYAKIESIGNALDEVVRAQVFIGEKEFEIHNISRTSNIVSLGVERGTKRYLFSLNYIVTIRKIE